MTRRLKSVFKTTLVLTLVVAMTSSPVSAGWLRGGCFTKKQAAMPCVAIQCCPAPVAVCPPIDECGGTIVGSSMPAISYDSMPVESYPVESYPTESYPVESYDSYESSMPAMSSDSIIYDGSTIIDTVPMESPAASTTVPMADMNQSPSDENESSTNTEPSPFNVDKNDNQDKAAAPAVDKEPPPTPPAVEEPASPAPAVTEPAPKPQPKPAPKPAPVEEPVAEPAADLFGAPAAQPVDTDPPMDDLFGDPAAPAPEAPPVADDLFGAPADDAAPAADATDDLFGAPSGNAAGAMGDAADDLFGAPAANAPAADAPAATDDLFGAPPADAPDAPAGAAVDDLFGTPAEDAPAADADDLFGAPDSDAKVDDDIDSLFNDFQAEPQSIEPGPVVVEPTAVATDEDAQVAGDATVLTRAADPLANVELRTWSDNTGTFRTEGRLVEVADSFIRLSKTNGNFCTVPLDRLSPLDAEYVRSIAEQIEIAKKAMFSSM